MYLKEAFRYQNFLETLMMKTGNYLTDSRVSMKTVQEHMKKKVHPEAEDEKIDANAIKLVEFSSNDLISFMEYICKERESLTVAISVAKSKAPIDIDTEIANNKTRQRVASVFSAMGNMKSSERKSRGTDYKFNAEGNQVSYYYEIKEVSTIDFDRNKVKGLAKRFITKADEISTLIDKAMVEIEVEFSGVFNVNDTYEDAVNKFLEMQK